MKKSVKNRALSALIVLSLIFALASCGSGSPDNRTPTAPSGAGSSEAGASAQAESAEYVFETGGTVVALGDDMAQVLAALGKPLSYFEATSCAFEGLDKTYTYSGFAITTRPEGDADFVNSILLTDDSTVTPEGLYIGCSAADVMAVYGEEPQTESEWVLGYTKGGSAMNFVLEDGKVVSIEYLPA